jgi:hypothetical protein
MSINTITSHHNLEREVTTEILNGAPHVVHCRTCKVGPMSLDEAAEHAKTADVLPGPTYTLYTIVP